MFLNSSNSQDQLQSFKKVHFSGLQTWKFCACMYVFERIMEQGLETCIIKTQFGLTDLEQCYLLLRFALQM